MTLLLQTDDHVKVRKARRLAARQRQLQGDLDAAMVETAAEIQAGAFSIADVSSAAIAHASPIPGFTAGPPGGAEAAAAFATATAAAADAAGLSEEEHIRFSNEIYGTCRPPDLGFHLGEPHCVGYDVQRSDSFDQRAWDTAAYAVGAKMDTLCFLLTPRVAEAASLRAGYTSSRVGAVRCAWPCYACQTVFLIPTNRPTHECRQPRLRPQARSALTCCRWTLSMLIIHVMHTRMTEFQRRVGLREAVRGATVCATCVCAVSAVQLSISIVRWPRRRPSARAACSRTDPVWSVRIRAASVRGTVR